MTKKCIVIGGGIIGLCTAYYLSKEGHQVTVIDKGNLDSGASYVNAGYITPSHIIPLSSPDIISKGLKWMLQNDSPFYVKPRLDLLFLRWAWSFKKSATPSKVKMAIPLIKDINLFSRELYEEMKISQDFMFSYERNGLLMCYKTEKGGEEEAKVANLGIREGLIVKHMTSEELNIKFPEARYNLKGAYYYDCDAHMNPKEFMQQLRTYLEQKGVEIIGRTEITDFEIEGDKIVKVKSIQKNWNADEVILTAGTWTGFLAKKLDLKISLEAGKGYSFDVNRETGITLPSILVEAKVAVTPMNGYTRFAGTMELGGINDRINLPRVDAIANAAETYFNSLKIEEKDKENVKSGLRPCSPDGLPYIGRAGKWKNLVIGTGHAMMGWSLGPGTGKLITELIDGKNASINLESYSPDRKF